MKTANVDKGDGESGESISFAESWGLTDYTPVEIAEQLTLIDAVCVNFCSIFMARFKIFYTCCKLVVLYDTLFTNSVVNTN